MSSGKASFDNTWFRELTGCYTALNPTPLAGGRLLYHNAPLAASMGLDSALFADKGHAVWHGAALLPGMQPLAQVYSGHQFGVWRASLATGAAFCWVSSVWRMAASWTGISRAQA